MGLVYGPGLVGEAGQFEQGRGSQLMLRFITLCDGGVA